MLAFHPGQRHNPLPSGTPGHGSLAAVTGPSRWLESVPAPSFPTRPFPQSPRTT